MNTLLKFLLKRYGRLTIDLMVVGGIVYCVCYWKNTDEEIYFGGFITLLMFMWISKIHDTIKHDNNNKD